MKLKLALVGIAALGGIALWSATASAMPNGLLHANQVSNIDQVRYVCNAWGRCWWRPNVYGAYDVSTQYNLSDPVRMTGSGAGQKTR